MPILSEFLLAFMRRYFLELAFYSAGHFDVSLGQLAVMNLVLIVRRILWRRYRFQRLLNNTGKDDICQALRACGVQFHFRGF
jgi:hypothetical protein